MTARTEAVRTALESGNFKLYDGSMDDPSDYFPWEIAIPGSYTIGKFREEFVARLALDALRSKVTAQAATV